MAAKFPRHWTHPQAIPRGFLRVYILTTLSRGPSTGYGIMQRIDDKTDGAWRPGPGTIYPLLKSLVREKLVTSEKATKSQSVIYTITPTGSRELEAMHAGMANFGRKERVMMRLVSDLMSNATFVPILLSRSREGAEFLRSRVAELPEPDRTSALRELESITQNQLDWIKSNLQPKSATRPRRKHLR